jgi:hypothetical protein
MSNDQMIMNWNGCGRKWSWPNLRYYPSGCLKQLTKTMKNLGQDSQCPTEFWTSQVPNTNQKHYYLSQLAWCQS